MSRKCNRDIVEGAEGAERRGLVEAQHSLRVVESDWGKSLFKPSKSSHTQSWPSDPGIGACLRTAALNRAPSLFFHPGAWPDLSPVRSGGLRCQDDPRLIVPRSRDLPSCQSGAASRSGSDLQT